ncbi:MAG: hypothetical protein KDK64_06060 [Chlamydiia bacterium]|nr:hypothetical protein [Chlamydiia bacterium]
MRTVLFGLLTLFASTVTFASETDRLISKCTDTTMTEMLRNKLIDAEIIETPFPHLIIKDFFPDDFYHELVNHWPHPHQFNPKCNERYSILLDELKRSQLTAKQKAFWGTFNSYLVETIVKPIIIKKFLCFLHVKFPDASPEELSQMVENFQPVANTNSIYLDTPSCSVPTHTDKPHCFVQLIFYLPADNDHQDVGTTFYAGSPHPGGENTCWDVPADLTYVKKLPYRKNTFIAFMQSPISWHALEPSPYPGYLRRSFFSPILMPPEIYIKHYGIEKYIINYLE